MKTNKSAALIVLFFTFGFGAGSGREKVEIFTDSKSIATYLEERN